MNHGRRVVITGLGVVAPNGIGKDAFWQALLDGTPAIDSITSFDASKYPSSRVAGEIRNFRPTDYMSARTAKSVGRFTQLAIASTILAVRDASLPEDLGTRYPGAVLCFGTSTGGTADIGEAAYRQFTSQNTLPPLPTTILELSGHAASSHISQALRLTGPTVTLASGCTSGLDAIAWGCFQISAARTDIAIVGASEVPISEFIFALFSSAGFLSKWPGPPSAASRPYDLLRSGLVLAEAAGALVLEELEHAQHRGAPIYAELAGYGSATEGGLAGNRRTVYARTLELAINSACQVARISPSQIDYVNAHGNSTRDDDAAETQAHKRVLGAAAYNTPVSSIKSSLGQPLSASGVLQVAATALSFRDQLLPPTLNLDYPDPDCDLDYVAKRPRVARVRTALVHAHSLGGRVPGTHTALILSQPSASHHVKRP